MTDYTKFKINNRTANAVEVFVTFSKDDPEYKCRPTCLKVSDFSFLKKTGDLEGMFVLGGSNSQLFDPKGKALVAYFNFYIPQRCPVPNATFSHGKYGTNTPGIEINPFPGCFELYGIDCSHGINSYVRMYSDQPANWTCGLDNIPVPYIFNKPLQQNSGNPGVIPVNCNDCTGVTGNPPCPSLPIGPAQTEENFCTVLRSGRGGTVNLDLLEAPYK